MQADSSAAKETVIMKEAETAENHTSIEIPAYETHEKSSETVHSTDGQPMRHETNHAASHSGSSGKPHHAAVVEQNDMEVLRNILVNNYRPVQPLNGRVVYRSFPFFNEPFATKCKEPQTVYLRDPKAGASAVGVSVLSMVCVLALKFM